MVNLFADTQRAQGPSGNGLALVRNRTSASPFPDGPCERKDRPETDWRLFDYDQTHVLAVLASYEITHGFQAGARFRYTTGAPRTPVTGAYFNSSDQLYEPIYGAHNSIRLPSFYSFDVRVEQAFVFRGLKFNVFADVQNVTNRKNPEEITYSANFAQRDYITGIPILAIVGSRMEF